MEFLQMIKTRTAVWPRDPTSGSTSEVTQNTNLKDIHTTLLGAVLFTTARIWKQPPKCPSVGGWVKKTWYICPYIFTKHIYVWTKSRLKINPGLNVHCPFKLRTYVSMFMVGGCFLAHGLPPQSRAIIFGISLPEVDNNHETFVLLLEWKIFVCF